MLSVACTISHRPPTVYHGFGTWRTSGHIYIDGDDFFYSLHHMVRVLKRLAKTLKEDPELGFDYLVALVGMDWTDPKVRYAVKHRIFAVVGGHLNRYMRIMGGRCEIVHATHQYHDYGKCSGKDSQVVSRSDFRRGRMAVG